MVNADGQVPGELPVESVDSAAPGEGAGSSGGGDNGGSADTRVDSSAVPDSEILRAEDAVADVAGLTGSREAGDERGAGPSNRGILSTFKLGDAVEEDARAVARSLTSLLGSLKLALSEVTGSSLEHMRTENEAAGQVQDAAIDAATKGNRFINACLRLNEEMKGMNQVAAQLEALKHRVDQFEHQSNRYLLR